MIIGGDRLKVIENIKKNVKNKAFHAKAEIGDPTLSKEESRKVVNNFWKNSQKFSHKIVNLFTRGAFDLGTLILTFGDKIDNHQKIKHIPSAFVTSNHYNQFDSLPVKKLALKSHKRLYFIIEDTNLLMPGWIGFMMRNVDSVPLSKTIRYLGRDFPKHLADIFAKDNWILIYPEQEMWFNYRKPRPLQKGTYFYAAKLNVPIISCFVEIQDLPGYEKNHPEFHKTRRILHVLPTIYPDPKLSVEQNARRMRDIDYLQKKKAYEKAYGKKLDYTFSNDDIAGFVTPKK